MSLTPELFDPATTAVSMLAMRSLGIAAAAPGKLSASALSISALFGLEPEDDESDEAEADPAPHLIVIPDGKDPEVRKFDTMAEFQLAICQYEGQEVVLVPFLGTHLRMAKLPDPGDPRAVVFADGNYIMADGSNRELDADEVVVDNYGYMGRIRTVDFSEQEAEVATLGEQMTGVTVDTDSDESDEVDSFLDEMVG